MGVTMELVKWLDHDNRRTLLNLINTWWESKNAPSALFLARVVPIFKKGDANIAANYRPISLLNNFYKLHGFDRSQKTRRNGYFQGLQNGFRPQKSTSHAIRKSKGHYSIWEKAFDKIQHDKLIVALHRLGFSRPLH